MSELHKAAEQWKSFSKSGCALMWDEEMITDPRWKISAKEISVRSGNCTFVLWCREEQEEPEAALKDIKRRLRLFQEIYP